MSWLSDVTKKISGAVTSVANLPGVGAIPGIGTIVGINGVVGAVDGAGNAAGNMAQQAGQAVSQPIVDAINADVASVEQAARDNFLIFGTYALLGIVMLIALYAIVAPSMDIDLGSVKDAAELAG